MSEAKYKVGVITNVNQKPLQQLQVAALKQGILMEQVPATFIPLSSFASSDFFNSLCKYDAVYYRTGMLGIGMEPIIYELNKRNIPLINACKETFGLF
ncbi:MAG: hypothetical protein LR008_01800 [Candidatus Pacebacteria bacterium]|nr:hypothetical protein [Candidatus Paceibacterota bacterium]